MNSLIIGIIILIILSLIVYLLRLIKRIKENLGLEGILEEYKNIKEEVSQKPKSVNGMDRIYNRNISKDFPQMNIEEIKVKAEGELREIFNIIEKKDLNAIHKFSESIRGKLKAIVFDLLDSENFEYFDDIFFHKTVIARYLIKDGIAKIVLQSSIGYINYLENSRGEILRGDKNTPQQVVYDMVLGYIQDINLVGKDNYDGGRIGLNCPNCGAPINNLGNKYCEHCGTGIVEINMKSWNLIDFSKR